MKKLITLIFLFIGCFQEALCQQITMNEAITQGLIQNPKLKAERAKIGISDAEIKEAGVFLNPKIFLEAAAADNSYLGGIQQPIELGGKRKKRILSAKANKEITIQQITEEVINLRSQIKDAYIELFIAEEYLKTAEEILDLTKKLTDIAQKRELAGQIAKLDVLQAETETLKAQNNLQTAKFEKLRAFHNLNSIIGNSLETDIEILKPSVNEDFSEVTKFLKEENSENAITELTEIAFNSRPEILALEKGIEKTKYDEKLARVTAVPDLAIGAGPQVNVTREDKTTTQVNIYATVEMSLPIYNHGQAALMKAKAERDFLIKQIDSVKSDIEVEIKNVYSEIKQNEKSAELYEVELLPKSQDILNKSELSYKEGKSGIIIPLNSQQTFIETKKGYINTLSFYYKSLNKLERAIGVNNENI